VQVVFALLVLESISILALVDCIQREPEQFAGGREDKRGWTRWLIVAVATAWFLLGNGIVLGYYFSVIRRNPARF
jgi:hypothetical protein